MAENKPNEPGIRENLKPLAVIVPAHIAVTMVTWWDLRHRSPEQVRGSKRFWRAASGANTLGSVLYFAVGRKRTTS